jgi:aspartyl-tRNA(Asn)/glutamyl-tRNA(Gln) amidotransferase subunit B
MEEDTGKLIHTVVQGKEYTLIDFNRSGVPLIEIVTEPDIHSPTEAKIFLKKLQRIIRYLGISDCDMEKGSMRCEANISLKQQDSEYKDNKLPDYKVEIKNLNSFRFVEKALKYEIRRQSKLLQKGEKPVQETRGWDENREITFSQRIKESAADYRYFPEPDIPPIRWTKKEILKIKELLPELPDEKKLRFIRNYGLSEYQAEIIVSTPFQADYFEKAVILGQKSKIPPIKIANIIINKKVDIQKVNPRQFIKNIIKKQLSQINDVSQLMKIAKLVIKNNKQAVADYKNGKTAALEFLIGQVLKETKGQANPTVVRELFVKLLK